MYFTICLMTIKHSNRLKENQGINPFTDRVEVMQLKQHGH